MPPKRVIIEPDVFVRSPLEHQNAHRRPRSDSAPSQLGTFGIEHYSTPSEHNEPLLDVQQEDMLPQLNTVPRITAQPDSARFPPQAHETEEYRQALVAAREREEVLASQMRQLQLQLDNMERDRAAPLQPPPRDATSTRDFGNAQLRTDDTRRTNFTARPADSHRAASGTNTLAVAKSTFNKVKASDVPKFHGNFGEDVGLWIIQVSAIYSQAGCSDEDLCQALASLLKETRPSCSEPYPTWSARDSRLGTFGKPLFDEPIEDRTSNTPQGRSATRESLTTTSSLQITIKTSEVCRSMPTPKTVPIGNSFTTRSLAFRRSSTRP
jgi:hypothetical protein